MITKILVAIDGSKISQKIVKYSIDLAKQTGASIVLLTVIDDSGLISQSVPANLSPSKVIEPLSHYLNRAAEKFINQAKSLCSKSKISCESRIRQGHPVKEILLEARKSKVDIIVLGSLGKSALESAVLGSVTYGVMHNNTKYPVLVIRK